MLASRRRMFRAASCLAALAWGSLGAAQSAKPPAPAPNQKFAIPGSPDSASAGRKAGAQPDTARKSKRAGRAAKGDTRPRPGAPVATFPGFRMLPNGGSRIYVELTKNVNVDERKSGGAVVFTLRGAQVLSRNNRNALITTHFSTPVARARLVPAGMDLDLVIDLRKGVDATHQMVPADNGTVRLEIDFPPGDYPLVPGLYEPPAGGAARSNRGSDAPETIDETPEKPAPARPAPTVNTTDESNKGSPPAP
jgi:hypothetical protein